MRIWSPLAPEGWEPLCVSATGVAKPRRARPAVPSFAWPFRAGQRRGRRPPTSQRDAAGGAFQCRRHERRWRMQSHRSEQQRNGSLAIWRRASLGGLKTGPFLGGVWGGAQKAGPRAARFCAAAVAAQPPKQQMNQTHKKAKNAHFEKGGAFFDPVEKGAQAAESGFFFRPRGDTPAHRGAWVFPVMWRCWRNGPAPPPPTTPHNQKDPHPLARGPAKPPIAHTQATTHFLITQGRHRFDDWPRDAPECGQIACDGRCNAKAPREKGRKAPKETFPYEGGAGVWRWGRAVCHLPGRLVKRCGGRRGGHPQNRMGAQPPRRPLASPQTSAIRGLRGRAQANRRGENPRGTQRSQVALAFWEWKFLF